MSLDKSSGFVSIIGPSKITKSVMNNSFLWIKKLNELNKKLENIELCNIPSFQKAFYFVVYSTFNFIYLYHT